MFPFNKPNVRTKCNIICQNNKTIPFLIYLMDFEKVEHEFHGMFHPTI